MRPQKGLLSVGGNLHLLHQFGEDGLGHCCDGFPTPDVTGQLSAHLRVRNWLGGAKFPVQGCNGRCAVLGSTAPDVNVFFIRYVAGHSVVL